MYMQNLMKWLSESFAPKANALFSKPWISAVSSAMQKMIPFILTGSLIYFYNVFKSFIPALPDLSPILNYSFGLISLIVAFMVANQCMEKLSHPLYTINAGIVSILILLFICMPIGASSDSIAALMGNLGPKGIAVGIIAGLFTSVIFHGYAKLHWMENSTSIPDFVTGWIHTIVPTIIALAFAMTMVNGLHINIFEAILSLFKPIATIGQSLPGMLLLLLIQAILYSMGISTWIMSAITMPICLTGIQENIIAVAQGLPAQNIFTTETMGTGLLAMGGCGSTLTLNLMMCFSKSRKLKTMGRIFIAPSIFNINEPIVFGAPIVFNPILMVPLWLNSISGPIIIYTVMRLGWLNIPSKLMQIGQIPAPISSVMITEDLRALLWFCVVFVVNILIWYPFYKVFERQCIAKEQGIDA